jgi:hypothetical protein
MLWQLYSRLKWALNVILHQQHITRYWPTFSELPSFFDEAFQLLAVLARNASMELNTYSMSLLCDNSLQSAVQNSVCLLRIT